MALFRRVYPPHLIGVIAGWGLARSSGPEGISSTSMLAGIEQHHIELLQALLLTLPDKEWGQPPAESGDFEFAVDTVKQLATAFHRRRLSQMDRPGGVAEKAIITLQELVRDHTQMVRNWGYYDDMIRIVKGLYAPLDEAFATAHGFRAADLVDVIDAILSLHRRRLNKRFAVLRRLSSIRKRYDLVTYFYANYPNAKGTADEFWASVPKRATRKQIRNNLWVLADRFLVVDLLFDASSIALEIGRPADLVRAILEALSLEAGALSAHDPEHLFLANPVWTRPAVREQDQFLFFAPPTLASYLVPVLRSLAQKADLQDRLEKRRGKYLESEITEVIGKVLPMARMIPGAKWSWQGTEYETDLIVVVDRVALVVEAKSGVLSDVAMRGGSKSMRRHVDELLIAPAIQSSRLRDILLAAGRGECDAIKVTEALDIDAAKIERIIRLSVSLDDLTPFSAGRSTLRETGWLPADVTLPPCIGLADLCVCATILHEPLYFLHYLATRERAQNARIFGDELDHLGTYLDCGLSLPAMEEDTHQVILTGMSKAVDDYYLSDVLETRPPMPRPRVEPYLAAVLRTLEERRAATWTIIGLNLLDAIPPDGKSDVEAVMIVMAERVVATPNLNQAIFRAGPGARAGALFHVFWQADEPDIVDRATHLAGDAHERTGIEQLVFIGRMLERWDRPYQIAARLRVSYPSTAPQAAHD